MKIDEIKIGMWLRNLTNNANHARVMSIIHDKPTALTWTWNKTNRPYSCRLDEIGQYFDAISTPAELTAAGIGDDDRLISQRNWREDVRLYFWKDREVDRVWFAIDRAPALCIQDRADGYTTRNSQTAGPAQSVGPLFDVTDDPRFAWAFEAERVRDFVTAFRRKRDEEKRALPVLKWAKCCRTIYRKLGSEIQRWIDNQTKWVAADSLHTNIEWYSMATVEQIASSGVPIDDVPESLRKAVEKLRTPPPTLPDGSKIEVGEMYVGREGLIYRATNRIGDNFNVEYFFCKGQKFTPSQNQRNASGKCLGCQDQCDDDLIRRALASDIHTAVDINIVPARIRDEVRKLRTPPASSNADQVFDLADGRRVGVSADTHCGKPALSVTELEAASSNASEKCCGGACQFVATLRDLIEAYDAPVIRTTDWLVTLARKFDLARESLGVADGEGGK